MTTQATPSDPTALPRYAVLDCRVGPGDSVALVRVRREGPTHYAIALRWEVGSARSEGESRTPDSSAPRQFPAGQAGEFVFDWDVEEIVVPVTVVAGALRPGQRVGLTVTAPRVYNFSPVLTRQTGLIGVDVDPPPARPPEAKARRWNEPIVRTVDPRWARDFFSDLVHDFTCTRSGYDAAGKPCFRNSLSFGQAQLSNGEVGLYSDPATDGTRPLQRLGDRRLLVPEKLPVPVTVTGGSQTKVCTYASPLVSTETNGLFGYGRFEYRFALLDPQQGMWPAGWSVCLPHWRWPDCEQDTVEISFNRADPREVLPYTTNWWRNEAGKPQSEGQFANAFALQPGFDHGTPHTYWSEWTPERMSWGIDDQLVFAAPNRFVLKNRTDPHDPNRIYMMLQIALGGAGGDCAKGRYPMAPSTYAPGQPAMLVDHIAHYAMPPD